MTASDTASDAKRHAVPRQLPWPRWRWSEDTGLIIVFVLMVLAIGIPHPEFFSFGSIKTILRQSALVGIIAFGMVYLVAMVEIDLSVGGIFAVASSLVAGQPAVNQGSDDHGQRGGGQPPGPPRRSA